MIGFDYLSDSIVSNDKMSYEVLEPGKDYPITGKEIFKFIDNAHNLPAYAPKTHHDSGNFDYFGQELGTDFLLDAEWKRADFLYDNDFLDINGHYCPMFMAIGSAKDSENKNRVYLFTSAAFVDDQVIAVESLQDYNSVLNKPNLYRVPFCEGYDVLLNADKCYELIDDSYFYNGKEYLCWKEIRCDLESNDDNFMILTSKELQDKINFYNILEDDSDAYIVSASDVVSLNINSLNDNYFFRKAGAQIKLLAPKTEMEKRDGMTNIIFAAGSHTFDSQPMDTLKESISMTGTDGLNDDIEDYNEEYFKVDYRIADSDRLGWHDWSSSSAFARIYNNEDNLTLYHNSASEPLSLWSQVDDQDYSSDNARVQGKTYINLKTNEFIFTPNDSSIAVITEDMPSGVDFIIPANATLRLYYNIIGSLVPSDCPYRLVKINIQD